MAARMEKTRHPGIYKRGSSYVVVWRHKGRQHKAAYRTLVEAKEAQGQRRAGERRPADRRPFEAYAREWLDTYRGRTTRGLGELTRDAYRSAIERRAIPYFRRQRLGEIEPPDIRAFIANLERDGLAASSIRKEVAPLRALFATALEDGIVRTNPTLGVRVSGHQGDTAHERPRALTREELSRLLGRVPDDWRLFFELLTHSGLRISEAIGLRVADLVFGESPHLAVRWQLCRGERRRLKTDWSRRDVPLSPAMAKRLWVLTARRPAEAPLFASKTGTPLQASNVRRRVLEPAREAAGLPWVGFHSLRHTCASLLFESGKDIKQVSTWLGHSDAGFTLKTYVHLMDSGVGDADFLDAAVTTGSGGDVATDVATPIAATA